MDAVCDHVVSKAIMMMVVMNRRRGEYNRFLDEWNLSGVSSDDDELYTAYI